MDHLLTVFCGCFQLRIAAFDTIFPANTATCVVDVTVRRNEHTPAWVNSVPVRETVNETVPLGYIITSSLRAVDLDNVRDNFRSVEIDSMIPVR